jgi:FtsH-binding integral membrane protein
MSARHQAATRALFEQFLIMILALLTPLIVSFLVYMVASAFGGTPLPAIGYGVQCISTADGACTLFNTGSTSNSAPVALPVVLVTALNSGLIIISLAVAFIEGIRVAPKLLEAGRED